MTGKVGPEQKLQTESTPSFDNVEVLFEHLEPLLDDHRHHREVVRDTIKFGLSPTQITELQQMNAHAAPISTRSDRRRAQRHDQIEITYLNLLFGNAKIYAQQVALNADPFLIERGASYYSDAQEIANDPKRSEADRYTNRLWIKVFENEQKRTVAERQIMNSVALFIDQSPTSVLELIQAVQECDEHEYYELLCLLQKDIADSRFDQSLVQDAVSELGTNPQQFKGEFVQAVDTELGQHNGEGEILDSDQYQWLSFIAHAVGKNAVIEHLRDTSPTIWPESIQTTLDNTVNAYLHDVWQSYKTMLDGFVDRSIYYLQPEFVNKLESTYYQRIGKRSSNTNQNGRAASNHGSLEQVVGREVTSIKPIESISVMVKAEEGWIELADSSSISEVGSMLETVSKRLLPKQCKAGESELGTLIESLISQPYGNGANKLPNETISILVDGFVRRVPLRIFRPASRRGLIVDREVKKLEIKYAVHPDKTRKELILLDISN